MHRMNEAFRIAIATCVTLTLILIGLPSAAAQPAPQPTPTAGERLASWNDTAPRQAILDFVRAITTEGSGDFVPAAARIAVFDMDGTLMIEKPVPAAVLPLHDDLKRAVTKNPELKKKPAIAALLKHDLAAVAATGERGAADIIAAITDGRTVEQAGDDMRAVIAKARHPRFERPYTALVYQPMLELLSYLRANGFQIWICSGSPVIFTRQFSQDVFGIPPDQVMGTSVATAFAERDGRSVLVYRPRIEHLNDKEGKPPTINLAVGRRPVLVGGNVMSNGDIAMMRYAKDRPGRSLQLLINHDDAEREYAYAEKDNASLNAAKRYGFTVVSMKNDWKRIFAD